MAYTPDPFSVIEWQSPITITPDDLIANLDDAINEIISTNALSLKNHINSLFNADLNAYLQNEFNKIYAQTGALVEEFNGIYLGAYSEPPTVDKNGNPPNAGDFYYDTTANDLMVYDGTTWRTAVDTYTKSDIDDGGIVLNAIKKVDGAGSGLDADLLDGLDSKKFLRSDVNDEFNGGLLTINTNSNGANVIQMTSNEIKLWGNKNLADDSTRYLYINTYDNASAAEISWKDKNNRVLQQILISDGGVELNGGKIWHSGNDGKGSGLDADLVRGMPADFSGNLSTTGYQKLPSGLIIQWGVFESVVDTEQTINFPISFPNKCFVVGLFADNNNGANTGEGNIGVFASITRKTAGSFTVNRDDDINGQPYFGYIAIGY